MTYSDGLVAILDMVIQGSHNAKIHAEMDSSYQKTFKWHIVQYSVIIIQKS